MMRGRYGRPFQRGNGYRDRRRDRYQHMSSEVDSYSGSQQSPVSKKSVNLNVNDMITMQPSKTILVVDIPSFCSERDLMNLFGRYGNVVRVQRLPDGVNALVEFSTLSESGELVQMARVNPFFVGESRVKLEFSNMPVGDGPGSASNIENLPSKVLHVIIKNCQYPITVDIIKRICSPYGSPIRIFIGKKNFDECIECMLEFQSINDAVTLRDSLNGADIYSGCCTLTINFSKIETVYVARNSSDSWDAQLALGKKGLLGSQPQMEPPLLDDCHDGPIPSRRNVRRIDESEPVPLFNNNDRRNLEPSFGERFPPAETRMAPSYRGGKRFRQNGTTSAVRERSPLRQPVEEVEIDKELLCKRETGIGTVILFHGLPLDTCCMHLFNMCCMYGNVIKVKLMMSRPGSAMVQMGNKKSAELCIRFYNETIVCGTALKLCVSKKEELREPDEGQQFKDGIEMYKNFEDDTNNRYMTVEAAKKARIIQPSRTLHFFGFPGGLNEEDIANILIFKGAPPPANVALFSRKLGIKTTGLVEWNSLDDSLCAFIRCSHCLVEGDRLHRPFVIKLSYSPKAINQGFVEGEPGRKRSMPPGDKEHEQH